MGVLDQFATKYDGRIQQAKRPLYLVALARAQEGNKELAEQLAERAWHLDPKQPLASFDEARELAGLGQLDWAVREYHLAFDNQPLDSPTAIPARVLLSVLLQDYERYQEAADAVEPITTALEKNRGLGQQYENLQRIYFERDIDLQDAASLALRQHFLMACVYEQQGDWAHQREQLLQALTPGEGDADAEDADVLIAMYRVHDADDAWRANTLKRINALAQTIEKQIEDNPNSGPAYNQWAWLISNTEGDYDKALRYSKRSLEFPTEQRTAQRTISSRASYLDTLGRCYYAVGDYENAIKNEREAVRLIPHMQVMLRQLAMFEKAAAEKGGGDPPRGTPRRKAQGVEFALGRWWCMGCCAARLNGDENCIAIFDHDFLCGPRHGNAGRAAARLSAGSYDVGGAGRCACRCGAGDCARFARLWRDTARDGRLFARCFDGAVCG